MLPSAACRPGRKGLAPVSTALRKRASSSRARCAGLPLGRCGGCAGCLSSGCGAGRLRRCGRWCWQRARLLSDGPCRLKLLRRQAMLPAQQACSASCSQQQHASSPPCTASGSRSASSGSRLWGAARSCAHAPRHPRTGRALVGQGGLRATADRVAGDSRQGRVVRQNTRQAGSQGCSTPSCCPYTVPPPLAPDTPGTKRARQSADEPKRRQQQMMLALPPSLPSPASGTRQAGRP